MNEEMITALARDISDQIIITPIGGPIEPYVRIARKLLRNGWIRVDTETSPLAIAQVIIENCTTEQVYAIRAALAATGG